MDLGDDQWPDQIVFGGEYKVQPEDLVAVAKPGVLTYVSNEDGWSRPKRMRKRNFRGQPSHGMFCSLDELKWFTGGPDEVAVLHGLRPGFPLDRVPPHRRARYVVRPHSLSNWGQFGRTDATTVSPVREPIAASVF